MSRLRAALILGGLLVIGVGWFQLRPAAMRRAAATEPVAQAAPSAQAGAPAAPGDAGPGVPPASEAALPADLRARAELQRIQAFTEWLGVWRRGDAEQRGAIAARGVELARTRRTALRELIALAPAIALDQAVPRSLRDGLPAEIAALLEEPIDAIGALQVMAVCGEQRVSVVRYAVVGDRRYEVFTHGRRTESLSKERVPLHGIAIDGRMALAEEPCRRLEDTELAEAGLPLQTAAVAVGEELRTFSSPAALTDWIDATLAAEATPGPGGATPAAPAAATGASWAHGEKSVLWVRAEFSDDAGSPATDDEIAAAMTQVNAYYDEVSRGRTSFKATILPGTLAASKTKAALTNADASTLYDEMKRLAKKYDVADGGTGRYDPDRHDRWILVFKTVPTFDWGGLGWIGASGVWLNGGASAYTTIHELGHNQGLSHSHAWKPTTASPIAPGEHVEYGDAFDEMGGSGHFNTKQKRNLEYLEAAETRKAAGAGVYRISRHDHRQASGVQAVLVDAGTAYDYWLEYRHAAPSTYYDHLEKLRSGITLRWGRRPAFTTGDGTYLLDMTPLTADGMQDAPLVLGESFVDPDHGITIVPVEAGGTEPNQWIDVQVSLGATGDNRNPILQEVSHGTPLRARSEQTFSASGSDPDGDTVYYRWNFGDGGSSRTTATVQYRWLVGGDYEVKVRALDGRGGIADRTINVAVADPLLDWTERGAGLTSGTLYDVGWTGSEFVAVGSDVLLSPDGVSWSKAWAVPGNGSWHGAAYGNGRHVAVGTRWSNNVLLGAAMVSANGLNWTSGALPADAAPLEKVAFGAGRFVAVGGSSTVYTSTDGAAWTGSGSGVTEPLQAIRYAEGLFVAAGDKGVIVTSPDGVTWTDRTPATATAYFRGVARYGGAWYVSSGYEIWRSADGTSWQQLPRRRGSYVNGLGEGFGLMLGPRGDGKIDVSDGGDGRGEVQLQSGRTRSYHAAAEANGVVVVVGEQGAVLQAGTPVLLAPRFLQAAELAHAAAGRAMAIPVGSSGYAKLELLVDGAVVQAATGTASTFSWTPPGFGRHVVAVRATTAEGTAMTAQAVVVNAGLSTWNWINPRPFGGTLTGAVEVDGRWWIVGGRDTLLVMDRDGNVSRSELGFANSPRSIAYGQGRFVVVANSYDSATGEFRPGMITSTDGTRWNAVPLNRPGTSFSRVVFDRTTGTWGASGSGEVCMSTDGVTWVRRETGDYNWLHSLACDRGRWVAVGAAGHIVTSTDGMAWTAQKVGTESLTDVATTGGNWVIVGGNGALLSSNDGVSWTRRSVDTTSWFESVAAIGGRFVAATYSELFSSADGVSWTKLGDSYWDVALNRVEVGSRGGLILGSYGRMLQSSDGLTWRRLSEGTSRSYDSVMHGGGWYVAVGDAYDASTRRSGPAIEISKDGRTWSAAACDAYHVGDVSFGNGRYVAVGRDGIHTSTDAQNWTRRASGDTGELRTVVTGGAVHVAAGADGRIVTSRDGVTWTAAVSPTTRRWLGAAHGQPGFVLVGEQGAIATSADGSKWTARTSGVTTLLKAVTWSSGTGFVAVGERGTILVSSDGTSWTRRDPGTMTELADVAATPLGIAVVASYGEQIFVSADGEAWAASVLPSESQLRSIAVGPQGWVAAGYNGIMLWHPPTGAAPSGPRFAQQPASQLAAGGGTLTLSAALATGSAGTLQWQRSGVDLAGATSGTLTLSGLQPDQAGLYAVVASGAEGMSTSAPAVVGVATEAKVIGKGQEVGADIRHPNGNVFDQVLLTGAAEAITADHARKEITRTSFIDLDGDIVQVEFAGPGTLSLVLDQPSGPAEPLNYHQPGVTYMRGHAGIIITGANENTHLSVFTVGRATANDPTGAYNILRAPDAITNDPAKNGSPLFSGREHTVYDGIADLAFVAITSTNGRFGGVRTANANYFAARGFTGIYAPGVTFTGPVFVGDIAAFDAARPLLVLGAAGDVRVTGGNMDQPNGEPVQVSGVAQLKFVPGSDSHGHTFAAQPNRGIFLQDGTDVTAAIVVNP